MGREFIASRYPLPAEDHFQQVDENSWLIGGFFYTIGEAPSPAPKAYPLEDTSGYPRKGPKFPHGDMSLVLFSGVHEAVWSIGKATLKIKRYPSQHITREHANIEYVKSKGDVGFLTPDVLYHTESDFGYLIVLQESWGENLGEESWGKTLGEKWPKLSLDEKLHFADKVASAYKTMAEWTSDKICGGDGNQIASPPLYILDDDEPDHSHEKLHPLCKKIGMESSTFVFNDNWPSPLAVIVYGPDEPIRLRCWFNAGFVPKDCIRTELCCTNYWDLPPPCDISHEWRMLLQEHLRGEGFGVMLEYLKSRVRSNTDAKDSPRNTEASGTPSTE
ncbi:hypothetical protein QQX98_003941 [Neonectria punicea]|uniref:Aminoglycoside phosphotransferase domain-containing protein n=1 Tax=Neonectria punicea TaxID=979145 RepID=A0ABR1HBB3_9HYPO